VTSVAVHADQLFYRVPGGIGTYVRELLPAMTEVDPAAEITAFHARFGRPAPTELQPFHPVDLGRGIRTLYPAWNATGRPPLPPSLAGTDVVHAPSPVAVPPARPTQGLVVTVHDLAFRLFPSMYPATWRLLYRAGLRRAARRADAIIAVSRHTATDLARVTRVDPARIHVVPMAVAQPSNPGDPEPVLRRLKIPRPYVLFAGTLEPRKNLVRLVRAYRRVALRVPHALVVTGPVGWRAQRIHRELALHGPGRVVLTGRVRAEELDALYRGADAFCYPSLYEGFGLPVLEAMARGVPTITSTASSLPEVAGDAAVTVDPRSVRGLAAALERVLTDGQESDRLRALGKDRAAGFTWERTARMTLDVYEAVRR
jgi:glycosyltransferase involved in cell wall biosynthesis